MSRKNNEPALTHSSYRPDIDGLRAVAVVSVILFHTFPKWVNGGFAGVDVFFVISGFLISSILFKSIDNGAFNFYDFYARRAKRIFPSLLVVLTTCTILGWYVLTTDEFRQLGKHIAAGAAFIANFSFWSESGYFDNSAETKPLLHLWSLGIEEQFYIVWPILLYWGHKKQVSFLHLGLALAIPSFFLNVILVSSHANAAFYLPIFRFWELLAGGLLAYIKPHGSEPPTGIAALDVFKQATFLNICSIAGAALLASSFMLLDKSKLFPGWWALMPVSGTLLLIAAGPEALVNKRLLSNRAMVWVGLISYPAYLWHWPLLTFGRILEGGFMSKELRFALLVATIVLAAATHIFVERRLPDFNIGAAARRVGRLDLARLLYGCMAVAFSVGFAAQYGWLQSRSRTTDVDKVLAAQLDWDYPPKTFSRLSGQGANFFVGLGESSEFTLFIGDSIVEQYAPRIELLLRKNPHAFNSAIFATGPACPPLPNVYHIAAHAHPICPSVTKAAYEIAADAKVTAVVIGGNWDNYLSKNNSELYYKDNRLFANYSDPRALGAALDAFEERVAELSKVKRVYILLNSPKGPDFSPKNMLVGSRWTTLAPRKEIFFADMTGFLKKYDKVSSRLLAIAARHNIKVIDPITFLCPEKKCPIVSENGMPLYMDYEHMRPFHVRLSASFIDETLRK